MFALHLTTCAFMCGVIWIIQILHYPAFLAIDEKQFSRFHNSHTQKMGYLVGPVMILELITGVVLIYRFPQDPALLTNIVLIAITWICTFFVSVPLHNALGKQREAQMIQKLVRTNWLRTILWTTRVALLLFILANDF